jgi:hypothetical protein
LLLIYFNGTPKFGFMTKPVPGPTSPESRGPSREATKPEAGKFNEAMKRVEAVEKTSESEFEKQGKRPFYQPSEEAETDVSPPLPPSGFEDLEPLPYPGSPFPDVTEDARELPESQNFWRSEPTPDEPPPQQQLRQIDKRERRTETPPQKGDKRQPPIIKQQLSPEIPDSPFLKKEEEHKVSTTAVPWHVPASPEKKQEEKKEKKKGAQEAMEKPDTLPSNAALLKEEKKPVGWLPEAPPKKGEQKEKLSSGDVPEAHLMPVEEQGQKNEKSKEKEKTEAVPIPDPLPPPIQAVAAAAQVVAAPYLSPQTSALFGKLIGTLVFMVSSTPGITRTEIVLNSAPFRNSVFYNSTVTLVKYSTAPDSFNIQLKGSPEAVKLFERNTSSLTNAFLTAYEERRIHFRVGRLETAVEQRTPHLIRRKEEPGEKGDQGGPMR